MFICSYVLGSYSRVVWKPLPRVARTVLRKSSIHLCVGANTLILLLWCKIICHIIPKWLLRTEEIQRNVTWFWLQKLNFFSPYTSSSPCRMDSPHYVHLHSPSFLNLVLHVIKVVSSAEILSFYKFCSVTLVLCFYWDKVWCIITVSNYCDVVRAVWLYSGFEHSI